LRTVWLEPGSAAYFGSLAYQDAGSVAQFEAALEHWSVPSVNQVYADTSGQIAWFAATKAPRRPNWDGLLPVPGDGRYEWNGFHAKATLPRTIDPARGYLATSNEMNIPEGPLRDLGLGYEWAEPFRAQRVREVLDAAVTHDLAQSQALQNDDLSIPARRICALLADLDAEELASGLTLLRQWNHHLHADSAAALLFEVWWMQHLKPALLDRVSRDPMVRPLLAPGDQVTLIDWLERLTPLFTSATERAACLHATLAKALTDCHTRFGDDKRWAWSQRHHGLFAHRLTAVGVTSVRDVGPLPVGGSGFTVMNNAYRLSDGRAINGASFRMVVDVGAWDNSRFVNAPGQSGHPGSPHYDDQAENWATGHYVPLLFTPPAVAAATLQRIVLEPA
jgi:penicillin amidase